MDYDNLPIPMARASRTCWACKGHGGKQPSDGAPYRRCGYCGGHGVIRIGLEAWCAGVQLYEQGGQRPTPDGTRADYEDQLDLQAGWDAAETRGTAAARIAEAKERLAARA